MAADVATDRASETAREVPVDVKALDDRAARDPLTPSRVKRPEALATLVATAGLLVQSVGYAAGWSDHGSAAITLWYVGFVVIVAPFAWLLLAPSRTGHQRLGASLAFGVVMYASWLLSDPIMSTRFDETLHVTTLVDMIDRHRFFYPNTLLPVSPHYPGLELATAGVHWLTGLPLIACEIVVDLVARSTFILALFLLASRIGRSTQVGAATVLLYGGSNQFYFFNSQFAYQTVAIAMLMAALYLLVRAFDSEEERPWKELLAAQVCLGALAVTHHLTSWIMLGLLWVLALAFRFGREQRRARLTLITAEIATIVVAAWTAVIAPLLIGYLGPIFDGASAQLSSLLDGTGAARHVGSTGNGQAAPTWELMLMAASILLWLLLLLPASWVTWRRGALGSTRARYVPLLIAVAFPALQVGRFSEAAGEVADRASTFVGMAMALVVGAWLATRLQVYGKLVIPGAIILVLGGCLLGSGADWSRVPGPYLAGAEQRSVDSETVAVAQWAGTYLPTDAHVVADSTFGRVLPNYAPVIPLTTQAGYDSMVPVYLDKTVDNNVLSLILHDDVDFIFVDTRNVGQTVLSGSFYDGGAGYTGSETVTKAQVTKFDHARGFHLILDGPVKVYDVRGLRGVPATFPTPRQPPGIPGSWTPWQVGFSLLLLLVGLLLRGRLFDPRRFRAKDVWRIAVVLPLAMVLGALGVPAQFNPVAGAVAAGLVFYVLLSLSRQPAPLPAGPQGALPWTLAISLVAGAAILVAVWSAWHGLLDHSALVAPLGEGSGVRARTRDSAASGPADALAIERGIWRPFRSLLLAQVLSAALGLVFWVLVAHLVDPHEVGVAAAAISLQTVLGIVTVMGLGTMLISELPLHEPARQRTLVRRSLLVVFLVSVVVGGAIVALHPLLPANLRAALGNPIGGVTFVLGVAAAGWAFVVDDSALAVRRSQVQVGRNLLASGLRFPLTAVLLASGFTQSHMIQLCWVLPLLVSVPAALWRLRLPAGDSTGPTFRADVTTYAGVALRNHGLSLSLASASQMVPVVAGLTLTSVGNAEFAIAWLMASFVFLPPYLLSTALFAHGANVSTEEFRKSMERTVPAALLLSLALCVGAWVLGEPVLRIFGGRYSGHSWPILALLVPGGLWMVFKDHLVALWRSQRRYALATRLAFAALLLEILGALVGAVVGGAKGLCIGWLAAMALEIALATPWLRRAFGGLHFRWPVHLRLRSQAGRVAPHVVGAVALVVVVGAVGVWSATRGGDGSDGGPSTISATSTGTDPVDTCKPTASNPGPAIDLGVQAATGDPHHPVASYDQVRTLVTLAKQAGASVISTSASFRTMQPTEDGPINYATIDRTIGAATAAGLKVKLLLVGMPAWALDHPTGDPHQPPRSDAELTRWTTFVRAVMKHVAGKVDYLEVWNEPNEQKWWPTGPSPVEFDRLLQATYEAVHAVAPATRVVSGGLIGNDIGFLEKMYDGMKTIGLKNPPFDLLGVHPFNGSSPPQKVNPGKRYTRVPFGLYDENYTGFTGLHEVMAKNGDSDVPIYITEFGYDTRAAPHLKPVTDAQRATYLTEALEQATCVPYVADFSWYALHPSRWDPPGWTMLDRSNHPDQTYAAMAAWGAAVAAATGSGS